MFDAHEGHPELGDVGPAVEYTGGVFVCLHPSPSMSTSGHRTTAVLHAAFPIEFVVAVARELQPIPGMRNLIMFRDREDGGHQLAQRLKGRSLRDPVVLAIPRGGVATGAVLARELGAELDVVLARKLRAPDQPELAVGAVGEDGEIYLNHFAREALMLDEAYLNQEREHQMAEIDRRKKLFRAVRPAATLRGRSVIVTDDGIATGSTMIAALHVVRGQQPHEVILAVPVAPPDRLAEIGKLCDDTICLSTPADFWAVGQFYQDFPQVEDEEVVELLRSAARTPEAAKRIPQKPPSQERPRHGRPGLATRGK